ncbi:MAG: YjjG family noncanonical pyrimidine nucleotidase [Cyclobacteriaceae bacterium]|jgi:putative hydrolase of the HAD superfamily|nr:YjjG family noncanonical pyrimidine nucleotidase [Cyclobacteriaceae bacterium]
MPYQAVLFDLDHTLWDYETNSREALHDLFHRYHLPGKTRAGFQAFYDSFVDVNTRIWHRYDRGEISRDVIRYERFHQVFKRVGIDHYELSLKFSHDYVSESPSRSHLMPHAKDVLAYLQGRYKLYIITNGFDEIQATKLHASGIASFFSRVVTSETAGCKKPSPEIFQLALDHAGIDSAKAIMIGDNLLTDMAGARNARIDTVFFNPHQTEHREPVTHEIQSLHELMHIL